MDIFILDEILTSYEDKPAEELRGFLKGYLYGISMTPDEAKKDVIKRNESIERLLKKAKNKSGNDNAIDEE